MNPYAVNPAGFCYNSKGFPTLPPYGSPSGLIVTGRENRDALDFDELMDKGCEVYFYLCATSCPERPVGDLDREFYLFDDADVSQCPLWIPQRSVWPKTNLTDMSNEPWRKHAVSYIRDQMFAFSGVFLDTMNTRYAPTNLLADWANWPTTEKILWATSVSNFVQELDAVRRVVNDRFKIICNGITHYEEKSETALAMFRSMDGCCIEHHPSTRLAARTAAARDYANLDQRRVLVITRDDEANAVDNWKVQPGVTHISTQQSEEGGYGIPTPPAVPFVDIRLGEAEAKIERQREELQSQATTIADLRIERVRLYEHVDAMAKLLETSP